MDTGIESSRHKNRIYFILRCSIAALLAAILIKTIGLSALMNTLCSMQLSWAIIAAFCTVAMLVIGAFNVWLLLQSLFSIRFYSFLGSFFYSWAVSLITPGQFGDASLAFFLKKKGVPLKSSGMSYLVDKVLTLAVLSWVAWHGARLFIPGTGNLYFLAAPYGAILVFTLLMILIRRFRPPAGHLQCLFDRLDTIFAELTLIRKKWPILLLNILITTGKWLIMSLCYYSCFRAFGTIVDWPVIGVIPVLSTLVGYLPITIGGVGSVEFTAVYFFSKQGIEPSIVLGVYVFLRFFQYGLAIMILPVLTYLNRKFSHQYHNIPSKNQ